MGNIIEKLNRILKDKKEIVTNLILIVLTVVTTFNAVQLYRANKTDKQEKVEKKQVQQYTGQELLQPTVENNVVEEKKSEIVDNEVNNELKSKDYVSPFPVPGYRSNDILWDFVCDISDGKNDKKSNNIIIGIKGLLMKKKPNSN